MPKAFDAACRVIEKLNEKGYTAYIAGGWVRDFLMNHPSDDIDIATDADSEEVQKIFSKTIPVGINFGIVIVVLDGHHFEVATFRKDVGYEDGRRPIGVEKATPEEDAKRRDFTINGLFYDPWTREVLDFVGGQSDIKKGVVRAIGNPHERFLEDRLRMIRAVRYSSRFHFPIETDTMQAILAHADQLFPAVARERIWQEFVKMALFAHFDTALVTLHRLNLLPTIFPSLREMAPEDIQSRLRYLPDFPKKTPVIAQILELFPESTLEERLEICESFRLSRKDQDFVRYLHKIEEAFALSHEMDHFEWVKLYAHPHFDACLLLHGARFKEERKKSFLSEHELRIKKLEKPIIRLRTKSPLIKSQHLKEAGVTPGKEMGALLEEAERIAANELIEDPTILLKRLKSSPHWPS